MSYPLRLGRNLLPLIGLALLLPACSKEDVSGPPADGSETTQRVRRVDGQFRSSESFRDPATGQVYQFDTAYPVSITLRDTLSGGFWFRMPAMSMFADRNRDVYNAVMPATADTGLFVAAPGKQPGVFNTGYNTSRVVTVSMNAGGDSLFFMDWHGSLGGRPYRIEHRFSGKLRP